MSRPAVLVDPNWHDNAVDAIVRLAKERDEFTSEDLRKVVDAPDHDNMIGVAFRAASQRKLIRQIGARQSRDKSRRGGLIRVWELHPSQRDEG